MKNPLKRYKKKKLAEKQKKEYLTFRNSAPAFCDSLGKVDTGSRISYKGSGSSTSSSSGKSSIHNKNKSSIPVTTAQFREHSDLLGKVSPVATNGNEQQFTNKKKGFLSKCKHGSYNSNNGGRIFSKKEHNNNESQYSTNMGGHDDYDPRTSRIAKAAFALDNAGNELFERGDYDRAMSVYSRALKLKNRMLTSVAQKEEETEEEYRLEGKAHPRNHPLFKSKVSEEGDIVYSNDLNIENHSKSNDKDNKHLTDKKSSEMLGSVATSINNIGFLRHQAGVATSDETMAAYTNSLQIKRAVFGQDNLSVGKTLNNLGTVHYLKRDYEPAMKAYMEAYKIMYTSLGKDHLDVGTVHSNIADVYFATNQSNDALKHYRASFEIRWTQLGQHDPKTTRLLEKIASIEVEEPRQSEMDSSLDMVRKLTKGANAQLGLSESDLSESVRFKSTSRELKSLHEEVARDIDGIDRMERELISDMAKDRLKILRDFRLLSKMESSDVIADESEVGKSIGNISVGNHSGRPTQHRAHNNTFASQSIKDHICTVEQHTEAKDRLLLSPKQRNEALTSLKQRLQRIREAKANNKPIVTTTSKSRFPVLKRIDSEDDLLGNNNTANTIQKEKEQNEEHSDHQFQYHLERDQNIDEDKELDVNKSLDKSLRELFLVDAKPCGTISSIDASETLLDDHNNAKQEDCQPTAQIGLDISLRESNAERRMWRIKAGIDALRNNNNDADILLGIR